MNEIPYVDLGAMPAQLKEAMLAAAERVLTHGKFILGPEVTEFEERFAELCGTRFAVGVASGTDALVLALRALGIGPGDEVITPPNSFVSSASAIALVGSRPVFVDVGADMNIDPDAIAAAVTPRTRAVMPVHLTGRPAAQHRPRVERRRRSLEHQFAARHSAGGDDAGETAVPRCLDRGPTGECRRVPGCVRRLVGIGRARRASERAFRLPHVRCPGRE